MALVVAKILSINMKLARKRLGLTQEELAVRVGVVLHTIGGYELGRIWPSPEKLQAIASALHTTPDQLLIDHGDAPEEFPIPQPTPEEALEVLEKFLKEQREKEKPKA